MDEYLFLFALAFIWTIFASVQDLRRKEIANWLNFSLLAFALAYRAFYASFYNDLQFFLLGLYGAIIFCAFANLLYYSKSFGGGDAKLLISFGAIIPSSSFQGLLFNSLGFIFALFVLGAVYTLIASIFLVRKRAAAFKEEFKTVFIIYKTYFFLTAGLLILSIAFRIYFGFILFLYFCLFLIFFMLLYFYLSSVEKACLIKLVSPKLLSEGDWLVKDVKIGNKIIKNTVHGLNIREIEMLRKKNKKVLIKYGLPFAPVFLITLIFMVFAYLFFGPDFQQVFPFLF